MIRDRLRAGMFVFQGKSITQIGFVNNIVVLSAARDCGARGGPGKKRGKFEAQTMIRKMFQLLFDCSLLLFSFVLLMTLGQLLFFSHVELYFRCSLHLFRVMFNEGLID